jgi:hypothetical protein
MANPLQPKVIKVLEEEYNAYTIKIQAASVAGHMDVVACIEGLFYGFEVKYKSDTPSELQKDKINTLIDKGGRGYFIRSIEQLRYIMDNKIQPTKYPVKKTFNI